MNTALVAYLTALNSIWVIVSIIIAPWIARARNKAVRIILGIILGLWIAQFFSFAV